VKPFAPPAGDPFPAPFRALLQSILQRTGVRGARTSKARSRRRALSQSGTFVGHRPYAQGDDLRRIDWNAYARSGELFVQVLEEDEPRASTILLDTSGSMLAGHPPRWTGALRLAAIAGGLSLRHLDGLRVVAGTGEQRFAGAGDLGALLQHLAALSVQAQPPLLAVGALLRGGMPGRVSWISDFAEPAGYLPALSQLRRHGCRVTGIQPVVADDHEVPERGWLHVVDPETGRRLPLAVDAALADELRAQLLLLERHQERVFAQCAYPLIRFRLPAADDFRLSQWLQIAWGERC
jgi:uncharacterized protein (DUF58 family)